MKLFIPLLTLFLITACQSPTEVVENKNEEQEYIEKYEVMRGTNVKEGQYTKTDLDGNIIEEATYKGGNLDGEQRIYQNGELYSKAQFVDGKFHGLYQTFYQGEKVNVEGEYKEDVMDGQWKRYYPDGQIMEVVTFKNSEENGPFVEFYPNGNVRAEGEYLNGDNEHGTLYLYDINGIRVKEMACEHGICRTTWLKEGREENSVFRKKDGQ